MRVVGGGSKDLMVGDLVLTEDKTESEGGSGTSGLKGKSVHAVTEEDVALGTYQLTDVVLPLIGTQIEYPPNEIGTFMKNVLKEDQLTVDDLQHDENELTLGGDYRKLVIMPRDVEWELKTYYDPYQTLIQTDLMKMNHEEIIISPAVNSGGGEEPSAGPKPDLAEMADAPQAAPDKTPPSPELLAMVISFTLPPSCYATVALRELMKRPTSSEYQSELMLEGRCERNLPDGMDGVVEGSSSSKSGGGGGGGGMKRKFGGGRRMPQKKGKPISIKPGASLR